MKLEFPKNFIWGTATSAFQIETASHHDWKGLKAPDGSVLEQTIEHEKHRIEDAGIIASLGSSYRCSLDWSRLQRAPKKQFETTVVEEYRNFLGTLRDKGVTIMLVMHHFANPNWFAKKGGWTSQEAPADFEDFAKQMINNFSDLATFWNTINEPTAIIGGAYLAGFFPPYKHNPIAAKKVLANMKKAHLLAYRQIKDKMPEAQVGVANNVMIPRPANVLGKPAAKIFEKLYLEYLPDQFKEVDFFGLDYYGGLSFDPTPIFEVSRPGRMDRLGIEHDDMFEYYPQGLKEALIRFQNRYNKPIIITENGCCTNNDKFRIRSIREHLEQAHAAIQAGVDLKGYYHWSTFDNWELQFGMSKRFGLVAVNPKTFERTPKPSAKFYAEIAKNNSIEL